MPELLREDGRVPAFTLRSADGREVAYRSLLRRKRIVLLVLSDRPAGGDNGRAWLREARGNAPKFVERDMTVLVIGAHPEQVPEVERLPAPFVVLRDEQGKVIEQLGGSPAFYLVGKDTGIKRASRTCPGLRSLFGEVDSMPMRRDEMRRRG